MSPRITDPWATYNKHLTNHEFYIVCASKWLVGSGGHPPLGEGGSLGVNPPWGGGGTIIAGGGGGVGQQEHIEFINFTIHYIG